FQAEDGIRDFHVTGVQTCALPIYTDAIPEMKGLKPDVALLPVSGTYVMTPEEAAQAAKMVEPKLAIPMHYGVIVGSEQDAQKFKQLATVEVQILKPE